MRIGIEVQRLFRKKKHGMDIVALELIRWLQKVDKVNQYFIFTKHGADETCFVPTKNFTVVKTRFTPYPFWEQVVLPLLAGKYQVDVLHCTSNTGPLFLNIPLILTLHDIIFMNGAENVRKGGSLYQRFGNRYRRFIVPRLVPKCKLIITVSDYARMEILRHFTLDENKVVKVYNGISEQFTKQPSDKELLGIRNKYNLPGKFVLFFGNTAPKKNLLGALDAFIHHTSPGTRREYRLVVADLEEKDLVLALRSLNALHFRDKIHLVGYVHHRDLVGFFHAAKLFLYPSLVESFGLPVLESMTCGTPVVSSNSSSIPEIAGNAALLVDPSQPVALGEAVENVLSLTGLYQKLVAMGYERVKQFSSLGMAKQIARLYTSCSQKTSEDSRLLPVK